MAIPYLVGKGFVMYDPSTRRYTHYQCRELTDQIYYLWQNVTGNGGTGPSLDDVIADVAILQSQVAEAQVNIAALQAQNADLQFQIRQLRGNLSDITDALSYVSDRAFHVD